MCKASYVKVLLAVLIVLSDLQYLPYYFECLIASGNSMYKFGAKDRVADVHVISVVGIMFL